MGLSKINTMKNWAHANFSEPGFGIGGDFPLSPETFFQDDQVDFYGYFNLDLDSALFFDSARSALRKCICHIQNQHKTGKFLLPAYLCPAILQPFAELQVPYDFYAVDSALRVNLDSLDRQLKTGNHGVLIIHYFGFPVGEEFRQYWETKGAAELLIEDCAQALLTEENGQWIGRQADYSVTSLRKFLPVPDGAWLVSDDALPATPYGFGLHQQRFMAKRALGMLLKGEYLESEHPNRERFDRFMGLLREAEADLDASTHSGEMSEWTKRLLDRLSLESARQARRSNYRYLLQSIEELDWVQPLFATLPDNVCPLGFPIEVATPSLRDEFRSYLIENGVYTPTHWTLPDEVPADEFPEAHELAERILTIPIDQRYGEREMDYIGQLMGAFKNA